MANVVYADPFGSYVKGQQAGQQQAINLGEAERRFRDSDREADFRQWYDPHRKIEVQTKENMATMQQNKAQMQMFANAALTGSRQALDILRQHMANTMGTTDINFLQYDKDGRLDPQATAMLAQFATGNIPAALMSTSIMSAGGVHKFPQYYSQYGGAGAGQTHDPLGLGTDSWGRPIAPTAGGGTAQGGQPGNIHTLPNVLAGDPTSAFYNPMQPGNEGAGIPVGGVNPQAYPPVSSMPGDETGGEMDTNAPQLEHYDQGTPQQNYPFHYAGEQNPSELDYTNPENNGRTAPNIPMSNSQVSFASPDDTGAPPPKFSYPPQGQAPAAIPIGTGNAPINIRAYRGEGVQNAPTAQKQFWADQAPQQQAQPAPTFRHSRPASRQMATQ